MTVFRILASTSNLCPNWDRACLLFTFMTAHGDLNLFPAGDLSYRKTLTRALVPYPSMVRGVAGRWTKEHVPGGGVSTIKN